jgi:hypothetical protein
MKLDDFSSYGNDTRRGTHQAVLGRWGHLCRACDGGQFPSGYGVRGGLVRCSSEVESSSNGCGMTSASSMRGRFGMGRATTVR